MIKSPLASPIFVCIISTEAQKPGPTSNPDVHSSNNHLKSNFQVCMCMEGYVVCLFHEM